MSNHKTTAARSTLVRAICVIVSCWLWHASAICGENPNYLLSIDGPCGEIIEGPAGSEYDDGTSGMPDFERGAPGWTWEVKLNKKESPSDDRGRTFGWLWAIGSEGIRITAITLNGTITCRSEVGPQCIGGGAFNQTTELTGAPDGEGPFTEENHGALSTVLLGTDGTFLPEDGSWTIAKIRVMATFPQMVGDTRTVRVFFTPRTGSTNVLTELAVFYKGLSITLHRGDPPLSVQGCEVTFKAVDPIDNFIRCDINDDDVMDIADPISLLLELFQGGAKSKCSIARDCNGDFEVTLSDSIYALMHLFAGGPPPPAPFPNCGNQAGIGQEDCPGGSTRCP